MLHPGSAKRRRSESGLSHRESSSKREDSSSPPRSALKEEKPFIGPPGSDGCIQVTKNIYLENWVPKSGQKLFFGIGTSLDFFILYSLLNYELWIFNNLGQIPK